MNYIIFGGSGFIGTHMAKLIKTVDPDSNVYNLDIVRQGDPLPTVKDYRPALNDGETHPATYVYCDVRQSIDVPFEITPDDIIFNFAAVHRTPGHTDFEYFETNIIGAENITMFAERHGIKHIVFTSSIGPYGASEEIKDENTLPTPNTPYGISKLVAEKIHLTWVNGADDRKLLILRPGVVFGKGENGNFSRLYRSIKGHKFAYPGRKDTIKAAIYVKELVNFILWQLKRQTAKVEIYNCTYNPANTIEQIVNTMKAVTSLKRKVFLVPTWILMPAAYWSLLMGSPLGICPARVRKLMISTNISGAKMASSGYEMKYSFEEALRDWYKDNDNKCLE